MEEKIKKFPKSKCGNFFVKDTMGVPHPYCITSRLVGFAADNFNGMLGKPAIEEAEKQGIYCDICKKRERKTGEKILTHDEHKQALVIYCKTKNQKLLRKYLLEIKDLTEKEGFTGFALVLDKGEKNE